MKGIYKWTNNLNNKIYIGKSVNIVNRLREYRYEVNQGKTRPIISALRRYGFNNFTFEIIEDCSELTNEELLQREQYWINFYHSQDRNIGYNILDSEENVNTKYSVGSTNCKARLNEEKVLDIRNMIYLQNIRPSEVYKLYKNDISYDAFIKAYRGYTWQNVDTSMIKNLNSTVARKGHKKATLSKDDVLKIRELYDSEMSATEIFEKYYLGICTRNTIKRVAERTTWKNI